VLQITSFLPSARRVEFLLFDWGTGTLLQSQRGVLGLCALWEAGLLVPAQLSPRGGTGIPALGQEKQDSPAGRQGLSSCQAVGSSAPLCTMGGRPSGATH
jgi:hypothetical protein